MNKVTNEQISVLYALMTNNSLIFAEAYNDDPILRIDGEFMDKMSQLVEFSKQIFINAKNDNIDFIDLNRLVLKLMFKAEEIRNTYSRYSIGYPYFNSIYDCTREAFVELANTL